MRRAFWVALGLGAGVTSAILVSRWLRRQRERFSPSNIGAQVGEGVRDLRQLLGVSLEEGRRAMREHEAEIRSAIDPDA
ncbi:MAG TPA: hypothetical protein VM638_07220 [Actinomycetota bacterium]|nr:hypothetical protein [Actinomycetota bacterium]